MTTGRINQVGILVRLIQILELMQLMQLFNKFPRANRSGRCTCPERRVEGKIH